MKVQATPLHFAISANKLRHARVLLKNGAKPNRKDIEGNTPMHHAVAQRSLPLVRLLDEFDADATIINIDDFSAIDIAIMEDIKDVKVFLCSRQRYKDVELR